MQSSVYLYCKSVSRGKKDVIETGLAKSVVLFRFTRRDNCSIRCVIRTINTNFLSILLAKDYFRMYENGLQQAVGTILYEQIWYPQGYRFCFDYLWESALWLRWEILNSILYSYFWKLHSDLFDMNSTAHVGITHPTWLLRGLNIRW